MATSRRLRFEKPDRYADRDGPHVDYSKLALPKETHDPDYRFREIVRRQGCQIRKHSPKLHPRCSPVNNGKPVIDAMHVPTGGKRALSKKAGDVGHLIGGCHDVHMEQHAIGWPAFEKKYGINAREIAKEIGDAYARRHRKERTR